MSGTLAADQPLIGNTITKKTKIEIGYERINLRVSLTWILMLFTNISKNFILLLRYIKNSI